ncbi:flagellar FliL protein [Cerasibacillus quisquiliarum]|uniref:Flagellar protein FliL n=1 Tax=Cerasibacillus quisquiliarum TaxID=227865 RepID=A0A511UV05_9BACI|nr:flagellar basal body-associated protein FliL [Cerasibacillus quisquiliarum]MBB5145864.1 flagellar FliL protein [Cerasibacillus quisquiliarum]GEN30435.1 flagellar protein FliL [Cerasibacillus quisquiliarum]
MNKFLKIMLTSFIGLIFVVGVAVVIVLYILDKEETKEDEMSINEIVEYSYETPEVTTDLDDGTFVKIQFQILTDGKKAKEELEKREFQIKNILIKELSHMDEAHFKEGLSDIEGLLKEKLNEVMIDGKITDVYTISKITQ